MEVRNTSLLRWFKMVADNPLVHRVILFLARRMMPKSPKILYIEPINSCNLKCVMCPYPLMTRKKETMGMGLFCNIVDQAVKVGIKEIQISHYGEPILDNMLPQRIRYAKSIGLKVVFFTNGTLLTHEKASDILDVGPDRVFFSIDGATKETYEKIRVGANFEKTTANIKDFARERNNRKLKKPIISLNVVLQKDNANEVAQLLKEWKGVADEIFFQHVSHVNPTQGDVAIPPNLQIQPDSSYPCQNISGLVVLSNGKVAFCSCDYDGDAILGDLTKQSIVEVWNSAPVIRRNRIHFAGKGHEIERCSNCNALYAGGYYWLTRFTKPIWFMHTPIRAIYYKLLGKGTQ